jgi:hypothetical protein
MKLFLCVALTACATSSTEELPTPIPIERPEGREPCAAAGTRLRVYVCRRDHDLVWTVKNETHVRLFAVVAPAAGPLAAFDRGNAIARMTEGHLVLMKMPPPPYGHEYHPAGVVELAPGDTDTGVVPIGPQLNARAQNFNGVAVNGTSDVFDVELEVAFIEAGAVQISPVNRSDRVLYLSGFDRKSVEMVRSPVVRWR